MELIDPGQVTRYHQSQPAAWPLGASGLADALKALGSKAEPPVACVVWPVCETGAF